MFCFTRIYAWLYYTGTAEGQIGDLSLLFCQDTSKKCQVCAFNGSWNLKETWGPSEVGYVVNQLTCSQRQWLHSSVGRASHQYREVPASNPVEVLNFFQASLRNCINYVHCDNHFVIKFSFHFLSSYMIYFIYHLHNCTYRLSRKPTFEKAK